MFKAILTKLREARRLAADRRELMGMTDLELSDMGIGRGDIDAVLDGHYKDFIGPRTTIRPVNDHQTVTVVPQRKAA